MKALPIQTPPERPVLSDKREEKASWYLPHHDGKRKGRAVYWTTNRIHRLGELMVEWFENNHTKVSLGSFCWEHRIPREYLSKFAHKDHYFDYCLKIIKSLLESRLLEMGLAGEVDKVMAIFSLKNIAGWSDKREVSSTLEIRSKIIELQLPKKNKPIEVKAEVVKEKKLVKPRRNANA